MNAPVPAAASAAAEAVQSSLEVSVLGVLLDGRRPAAWETIAAAGVSTDSFVLPAHRLIFYVCQQMAADGRHIDAQTVNAEAATIRYDDAAMSASIANRDATLDYDASVLARIGFNLTTDIAAGFAPAAALAENAKRLVEAQRDRAILTALDRFQTLLKAPHAPESRNAMAETLRELLTSSSTDRPTLGAVAAEDLVAAHPEYRRPLIAGLLREGETMNVIASPKVGKSWLVLLLAFSLANGRAFLGLPCAQCPVLLIDNELHPETAAQRLRAVATALDLPLAGIHVVSLRGRLEDLPSLRARMIATAKRIGARVIVLDALYRLLPAAMSENDNAAMMHLYNGMDRIAAETGAAIVCIHHSSKGDQSGKSVTDGGAGAGAISRAADTHVLLRPHEQEGHVVIDAVARSWPPPPPIVVRRDGVLWALADADPAKVAGRKPQAAQVSVEDLVARVPRNPTAWRAIAADANARWRLSAERTRQLLAQAVQQGLLHTSVGERSAVLYSREPAEETGTSFARAVAYLRAHPDASPRTISQALGITERTAYRARRSLADNVTDKADDNKTDNLGAETALTTDNPVCVPYKGTHAQGCQSAAPAGGSEGLSEGGGEDPEDLFHNAPTRHP